MVRIHDVDNVYYILYMYYTMSYYMRIGMDMQRLQALINIHQITKQLFVKLVHVHE